MYTCSKGDISLVGDIIALASHPAALGLNPRIPQKISEEKLLMLLRLINGAGKRKIDSGMKMLIDPI